MDGPEKTSRERGSPGGSATVESGPVDGAAVTDASTATEAEDGSGTGAESHRLHRRVQFVWGAQAAFAAVLFGVGLGTVDFFLDLVPAWVPVAVGTGVFVAGAAYAALRYRSWRYEIRDDALYLERGVFTNVRTVVPFVRIQHIDSSRDPPERLLGLSTLVVYTAGSRGADVAVPGLSPSGATDLRERLKELAIDAEGPDGV